MTGHLKELGLALLFAIASTAVWAGILGFGSDNVIWDVRAVVNFGGVHLSSLAQWFVFSVTDSFGPDWKIWAWYAVTEFAGAFVQGVGYAILGLAFMRGWRRSKSRALAAALGVVAVLGASYKAGATLYERATCVSTIEPWDDGVETFIECPASLLAGGPLWATVAFAIVVLTVVLLERRARQAESVH